MIVVCTGCSAKFKVADEKVGPKGAKLRCSRCQAIFTVRREEPPPPEPTPPPAAVPPAVPPPLPSARRQAAPPPRSSELGPQLDARAAFEIDLEPAPPRPAPPEPDPFAPPLSDDPFAAPPPPPAEAAAPAGLAPTPPADPFGAGLPAMEDPFAAVQAPVPEELLRSAPPEAPAVAADDPFAASLPPLGGAGGDLALEERTTPSPRHARPQSSAPLDDPFGGPAEPGGLAFDAGHPGDIPPMAADLPGEPFGAFAGGPEPAGAPTPPPAAPPPREPPLRVDPFAAAAVDADPLRVAPPPGRARAEAAPPAEEPPAEATARRTLARLRGAAVNAISLLALLVAALALLLVWRGDVPLSEAIHPGRLLAALTHRQGPAAAFAPRGVTSGLYERARGAPLLFVKGEVVSAAAAPVAAVTVAVELVKDGAVVARAEGLAGGVPTPEELYEAADAAALGRVAAAAAARAPGPVQPGQALPFLVALADYPADLVGVALRVRAEGGAAR